ncbi:MAG TPA: DUF6159 family protein [Chitinophagaceae bacterium]|nr:DUF6159 family protein [Chitinophagaceae bacterium]
MRIMDRFSRGWRITMNSFRVLAQNKQLILFPMLSGLSLLLIIGSFFLGAVGLFGWDLDRADPKNQGIIYLVLFAFYVINYFVVVFFNMALMHCTRLYFKGKEVTLRAGLAFSLSRLGVIFSWSLIAGTVGVVLRAIQQESGIIGKILAAVIGVVWSVATFFVVPVLAYENLGPLAAIRRSSQLMKAKWGESLSGTFSFGLIQFIAMLLIGLLFFLAGSLIHPVAGIALAAIAIFLVLSILSAAQTIFVSAVYHDVTDDPVSQVDRQLVDNLFVSK